MAIALAGMGLIYITHKPVAHLAAGKRYRFAFTVEPAVLGADLASALAAITASGALEVTTDNSDPNLTRGSYVMVNATSKDVPLGPDQPFMSLGGHSLYFTSIDEVPA
jgi:hypothetical protein